MLERVVLSRWSLVFACIACVLAMFDERPPAMETRPGEPHGIVGVSRDVYTRIVSDTRALRAARSQMAAARVEAPATATFHITNSTSTPLPPQALAAFTHATDIWARLINSAVPIRVFVAYGSSSGFLAFGSAPIYRNFPNAPQANVWYSKPLADALAGVDIQPGIGTSIQITFNSATNWYFGTDGNTPPGHYDFVTVALHEITHHLGFVPLMWGDGGFGISGVDDENGIYRPSTYSRRLVNGSGQFLINFPNFSVALGDQLSSNNIFWSGPVGIAALGGVRPKIYTPNPWVNGQSSSLNHLDETTYPPGNPNSLMTPVINTAEAIHVPGPATLGMLADMGWAPDSTCTFGLDRVVTTVTTGGVTNAVVNVTAPAICAWTAASNSPFITVTSGAASNGPSPMTFSVSANAGSYRTGTITIAGRAFTVNQLGNGPTMTLDKTSLTFGALSLGGMFTSHTSAQVVRLRQSGLPGTVAWTAQSTSPWLTVSPASGTGSADLSISIAAASGLPISGLVTGGIQLTFNGAATNGSSIDVALTTIQNGLSVPPIGVIDTPVEGQSGITGAIALTGWALDDIEIDRVAICRVPYVHELANPIGPHCGGRNDVFLGFATRVDGARPDVAGAFLTLPQNTKGGWGYMLLTNMLPAGGNGAYVVIAFAYDREGMVTQLGNRTIFCSNDSATKPFGAIDTPEQGGVASGGAYVNFGWALTQNPKTIPIDGSTITVLVDGTPIGNPTYNNFRDDIATLFPGRTNSNGAVGYRVIDTTALDNGVHTISWVVTDDQGNTDGIGSRYFTVSNGSSGSTAAVASARVVDDAAMRAAPLDRRNVVARRGFDLNAPWTSHAVNADGHVVIRGEELDRFELALDRHDAEQLVGFLRAGDRLEPLPAGTRLDASTGSFTWAPGVGFVGAYDLVFVRSRRDRIVSRQDVRFILHAKGSGRVGPQVTIDTPRSQHDIAQPFTIAGWAVDLDASDGTGIGAVHVWAYPLGGGPPVFLGAAATGGTRLDVAAIRGARFRDSGFGLIVQGLAHGNYDLAVFAWSNERGDFAPAKVVRVTVR